jgi:hypothetical protein
MNQAGESGRTIERFTLVGESLPSNAKPYRFFFLTGSSPALYVCFTAGIWTQIIGGGAVVLGGNAAPADGDISTNQAILWFDPTTGSASLNIKAKQADGTIVTGQVLLS